ncbi:hypothetical protein LSH36_44g00016 [Paralvinella palmiformis]|uniref:Uncharacterized protein n=1 Tax=Paralvinella palmiformis TaxID=53620 RepID=A0AAD9NF07_9ANNE|nr:hypothetical protein LSH36_44g00016 [Paralvinella palmiformis]
MYPDIAIFDHISLSGTATRFVTASAPVLSILCISEGVIERNAFSAQRESNDVNKCCSLRGEMISGC